MNRDSGVSLSSGEGANIFEIFPLDYVQKRFNGLTLMRSNDLTSVEQDFLGVVSLGFASKTVNVQQVRQFSFENQIWNGMFLIMVYTDPSRSKYGIQYEEKARTGG